LHLSVQWEGPCGRGPFVNSDRGGRESLDFIADSSRATVTVVSYRRATCHM
jgi:hypothetical protein